MQSMGVLSLNHDITTSFGPSHTPIIIQSALDLLRHKSVRVDPYAHSQQIRMWDTLHGGFEPQPWHFNIIHSQLHPNLNKIHPRPAQAQQCKGGPVCSSTACQGAKTLCIYIIWMRNAVHKSTGVWILNHDITAKLLGFSQTPIFIKSTLNMLRHNSVRVDPYAHPQHVKVLKHFIYIW